MDRQMEAERLADGLAAMARDSGCGLLVTTSRRTGAANEALLRERLQGLPVAFWDGTGENPYFGYLALADAVVVTGDSVNMVSEACFTGKPVHVFGLAGGERSKFGQFHKALADSGATRPFAGRLESWPATALDERTSLADEIRAFCQRAGDINLKAVECSARCRVGKAPEGGRREYGFGPNANTDPNDADFQETIH